MKKILRTVLLIVLLWSNYYCFSNDILISNISLSDKNSNEDYVYLKFDISWENSWRINTDSQNWDAAWVFAKFRIGGGEWRHVNLSPIDDQHFGPDNAVLDVTSDGKGVFIYRANYGSGIFSLSGVKLKWLYGLDGLPDEEQELEIKVFGIEMVYVPSGSFYVGDGSSDGRLWDVAKSIYEPAIVNDAPVVIKCESTDYDDVILMDDGIIVDGDAGITSVGSTSIENPDFPTGYLAFYCMKHEISAEQYVEFLNTLNKIQQDNRVRRELDCDMDTPYPMSHYGTLEYRNGIRYSCQGTNDSPVYFFCDMNNNGIANEEDDGQDVGCSFLGWADGAAYADWAGLRPMTELEFEKACRGPEIPIADDFAWHNTSITGTATDEYVFIDLDMSTMYPQNPGEGVLGNAAYVYTTGHVSEDNPNRLDGPVRVGMFATSTSDRVNAGASYYGILDLTGGMAERCVTIGKPEGRSFKGTHGDGRLSVAPVMEGNATNSDWPGISDTEPEDGVKIRIGSGYRGGDWNDWPLYLQVSNRTNAAEDIFWADHIGNGNPGSGFRGVRTAENE